MSEWIDMKNALKKLTMTCVSAITFLNLQQNTIDIAFVQSVQLTLKHSLQFDLLFTLGGGCLSKMGWHILVGGGWLWLLVYIVFGLGCRMLYQVAIFLVTTFILLTCPLSTSTFFSGVDS